MWQKLLIVRRLSTILKMLALKHIFLLQFGNLISEKKENFYFEKINRNVVFPFFEIFDVELKFLHL